MHERTLTQASLVSGDGLHTPLGGSFSFGRTEENDQMLLDERVSRRHAVIHRQRETEFWLVDLGSRNGTYVNDHRLTQPVRLRHGDVIRIGPFRFTFSQPATSEPSPVAPHAAEATMTDLRAMRCWLLVADVAGSSRLAQSLSPVELALRIENWFRQCKHLVEAAGGRMNKALGDGFLAFWNCAAVAPSRLVPVLAALRSLQSHRELPFRWVLHHGEVLLGGASLGEESLSGVAVNFVFRLEKLAASLGRETLLSEAAATALQGHVHAAATGQYPLAGFEGTFPVFAFEAGAEAKSNP